MKNFIQSFALLTIACTLFNCSNPVEPTPSAGAGSSRYQSMQAEVVPTSTESDVISKFSVDKSVFRLVKTLTMPQGKGFNLLSPFAITTESGGDIGWGSYGCYAALKPVKVSFHNLQIVDVASITPAYLNTLPFNQFPIANAPAGSAFWTNYMPAKTIIACKTSTGKYYLIEVLGDNPLAVNIFHPVRI